MIQKKTQVDRIEKAYTLRLTGHNDKKVQLSFKDEATLHTYISNYSPGISAFQLAEKTKNMEYPVHSNLAAVLNRCRKRHFRQALDIRFLPKCIREPLVHST